MQWDIGQITKIQVYTLLSVSFVHSFSLKSLLECVPVQDLPFHAKEYNFSKEISKIPKITNLSLFSKTFWEWNE